jgi:glutathione synthase/RimK-type ligase-like ATP-grasp enzyme
MKIAIHPSKNSFSERWIEYCKERKIPFKLVNCYNADIIEQMLDCDALMWHFHQGNPKDILFAKQLLWSLQVAGKKVFPDFNTAWHFDDKVGQKYMLESIGAPLVPTWIFYEKNKALEWAEQAVFPKVFKLRGGGGSQNVKLVVSKYKAFKMINQAFGKGFPAYDPVGSLKERWRKYRLGKTDAKDLVKGLIRFLIPPPYARVMGRERGYIYFQEFIPGNNYDIRIVVIGDKAFGIKRMVRENDFRASGSGHIIYEKEQIDEEAVKLSFDYTDRLQSQCAAFDFLKCDGRLMLVEVSYGFVKEGYDPCPGYWDKSLNWHEGKFNPYGWIVENLIISTKKSKPGNQP